MKDKDYTDLYNKCKDVQQKTYKSLKGLSEKLNSLEDFTLDLLPYQEEYLLISDTEEIPIKIDIEYYKNIIIENPSEFLNKSDREPTAETYLIKVLTDLNICCPRFIKTVSDEKKTNVARYFIYESPGDMAGECIYALREVMALNGYYQTYQMQTYNRYYYQFEPLDYIIRDMYSVLKTRNISDLPYKCYKKKQRPENLMNPTYLKIIEDENISEKKYPYVIVGNSIKDLNANLLDMLNNNYVDRRIKPIGSEKCIWESGKEYNYWKPITQTYLK